MVNGYKTKRHDPWYRIILGSIYHRLVKWLSCSPLETPIVILGLLNAEFLRMLSCLRTLEQFVLSWSKN